MSPPVQFTGSITCAATGVISFSPTLVNGGSAPSTVKVKVALKKCTDTTQSGVTITRGALTATSGASTVTNDCGSVTDGNLLPSLTGEIKWAGHGGRAEPTTVTVGQPAIDYDVNGNIINTYLSQAATSATGSFASEQATFSGLGSKKSGYLLDSECGTTKGLGSVQFGKVQGSVTGTVTIQEGS
jgi:hypothetical protein